MCEFLLLNWKIDWIPMLWNSWRKNKIEHIIWRYNECESSCDANNYLIKSESANLIQNSLTCQVIFFTFFSNDLPIARGAMRSFHLFHKIIGKKTSQSAILWTYRIEKRVDSCRFLKRLCRRGTARKDGAHSTQIDRLVINWEISWAVLVKSNIPIPSTYNFIGLWFCHRTSIKIVWTVFVRIEKFSTAAR